uniref:Leucine rich repeat protein n=1 Tax=Pithovirus LCDPAC01 TaxID=2506600 RepID=A0A481YN92_9VIRU|nr:MAG: hypothetical protein LCDPAC01_00670 [Pithovirus LCDPAC01]
MDIPTTIKDYTIPCPERFNTDRLYIENNKELIGKTFYFKIQEQTETYAKVGSKIYIMTRDSLPSYFKAIVSNAILSSKVFLLVSNITQFPYSKLGELRYLLTRKETTEEELKWFVLSNRDKLEKDLTASRFLIKTLGLKNASNTYLDVRDVNINNKNIKDLLLLTGLNLNGKFLRSSAAIMIALSTSLITLNIDNNRIGLKGIRALSENKVLRILSLADNGVTDEGAVLLSKSSLTSLNLGYNRIGDRGVAALTKNGTLTSLNLRNNRFGNIGVLALSRNKTLRHLNLSYNEVCENALIKISEIPSLTSLCVCGNASNAVIVRFVSLIYLDVSNNSLDSCTVKILSESKTLKSLWLRQNRGPVDIYALVLSKNITYLDLSGNHVKTEDIFILSKNLTLKTLVLNNCGVSRIGAITLSRNFTLTSLSLYENNIHSEGVYALSRSKTLRYLELDEFDDEQELFDSRSLREIRTVGLYTIPITNTTLLEYASYVDMNDLILMRNKIFLAFDRC